MLLEELFSALLSATLWCNTLVQRLYVVYLWSHAVAGPTWTDRVSGHQFGASVRG